MKSATGTWVDRLARASGVWAVVMAWGALLAAPPPAKKFTGPIPQEVWAMRDDPALVAVGAVILEERWSVGSEGGAMEHLVRVRILGPMGRAAAELDKFGGRIEAFEGRVAYPDGTFLELDAASDLHEKELLNANRLWWNLRYKRTILVVPGITADCVLELRTKIGDGWLGGIQALQLQHPFPTRKLVVELHNQTATSILFRTDAEFKGETVKGEDGFTSTFNDLPASRPEPFLAPAFASANTVYFYRPQFDLASAGTDTLADFWTKVSREHWRRSFDFEPLFIERYEFKNGASRKVLVPRDRTDYDKLLAALGQDLPDAPQARALELHARLVRRVRQWPETSSQYFLWAQKQAKPGEAYAGSLAYAIQNGAATEVVWRRLYYTLLRDLGVRPYLVFTVSAHNRPFTLNLRTREQFDGVLFGVREEGKPSLYLDTACKDGHPDRIPEAFQGTTALCVETARWTASVLELPWQGPLDAVTEISGDLVPGDGGMAFRIQASFAGAADSSARQAFAEEDGPRRLDHLARILEAESLDTAVAEVTVGEPEAWTSPFGWSATGRRGIGGGVRLLVPACPLRVDPFQAVRDLPEARQDRLYLGPPATWRYVFRVTIPQGYRWVPDQDLEETASFGSLRRSAVLHPERGQVEVTLQVATTLGVAPVSAYGEFRNFLAAWQDAAGRPILLERIP